MARSSEVQRGVFDALHYGVGVLLLLLLAGSAAAEEFNARLGRVPVDSRNQTAVTGLGHAHAELDGNRLTIEGEFSGLAGPATTANLHLGRAVGVRGNAIHALQLTPATAGKVSASLELSASEVAALHAGRLYVQIHSESAPDGNLWGWLLDR
jgi:hypothetical protein